MANKGDDSGSDPKFVGLGESGIRDAAPEFGGIGEDTPSMFVGGGDTEDAPSLKRGAVSAQLPPQSGSETAGGTDQQQGQKRKNREISEAGQPAEKEGMDKDKKYRANKKAAQQEMEKQKNDLKAKNEKLESENMQLKWDMVELEKQVLKLKAEVQKQTYEREIKVLKLESDIKDWKALAEKEKAVAEKEKAVADKEKAIAEKVEAEKIQIQYKLDANTQELQTLLEELRVYKIMFDATVDGSLRQGMSGAPPKLAQGWATRIRQSATPLINPSTKLPCLQGREEFLNSISSSVMSLFKYTKTKMDAKRRFAIEEDDWEKNFHRIETLYNWEKEIHRIENLCILNSHFEPLRKMGSNRVLESFIQEEIYRTLRSCCESLEGEYDELMALAQRIRDSTILQSYAGNLDCDLIDLELGRQDALVWRRGFYYKLLYILRPIEILHSIRRYAQSLRVEKKPLCIRQLSFASEREMWSGIRRHKPLRKNGGRKLYELKSFYRLLAVKRGLAVRINKLHTLRSHFDDPKGRGDLVILVKNSARSVWKFRCATQATCKPVIVGDLVDDQIVFYEGDLPTGAHYTSEIVIVGLGLATWVELESFD